MSLQNALPYARLCMVYSVVLAAHVAFTPPAQPQRDDGPKSGKKRDQITRAAKWHPIFMKSILWTFAVCESSLTFAATTHMLPVLRDVLRLPSTTSAILTVTFVLGWFLVLLGGTGRALCYRALGRHFTFELTLQDGHRLVTYGPYALVRHPSYSAIIPVVLGLPLVFLGPGSWAQTSGFLDTVAGKLAALLWAINLLWLPTALISRVDMEDNMLKREFGQEWADWAKKTPYKLVPGVY